MILAEALISVTMLASGSIIVGNIIHDTVTSIILAKNYMIAQNLATEGLEAVKNIRDTNWLMKPDDEDCWLRENPINNDPCSNVSIEKNYIAKQEGDNLMLANSGIYNGGSVYLSHELDIEESSISKAELDLYKLYTDDISSSYSHNSAGTPSPFWRGIHLTIQDDTAVFRARVQWREGAAVRKLERTETIYNSL